MIVGQIAHYGVDRHLMHNAVYSLTSGGQSVLYEHLTVPLMKAFGMNVTAFRFPMALLTTISIIVLIYALYRNKVNPNVIAGVAFTMSTAQWLFDVLSLGNGLQCDCSNVHFNHRFYFTWLSW